MVKYLPDYYKILNINPNADTDEIKEAYEISYSKYKAKKSSKTNNKMIKLINDAYVVLSDENKRRKYDNLRNNAIKNKKSNKKNKNSVEDTFKVVNDVKDNYDLISKLFKTGSGAMKGKSLFTGTNLIIGGAMAGYGVKKGRDYMAKRARKKEE